MENCSQNDCQCNKLPSKVGTLILGSLTPELSLAGVVVVMGRGLTAEEFNKRRSFKEHSNRISVSVASSFSTSWSAGKSRGKRGFTMSLNSVFASESCSSSC